MASDSIIVEYDQAEYDQERNLVVAMRTKDGRVKYTRFPRVLGNPTIWVPVETVYPPDFDPRFEDHLHSDAQQFRYDANRNVVEITFPDADFSPAAIRETLHGLVRSSAWQLLWKTDWYVTRKIETGKEIPEEVISGREAIRASAEDHDARIDATPDESIKDFVIDLQGTRAVEDTTPVEPEIVPGGDGSHWITDATSPDEHGNPVRPANDDEVADQ